MNTFHDHRGFSIIELLMIISTIAILGSLFIVVFNPITHVADARNAERWNHINTIANIFYRYQVEHEGALPDGVDGAPREICKAGVSSDICKSKGYIELDALSREYQVGIPSDPLADGERGSGYAVSRSPSGGLVVTALMAEDGDTISVRR